MRTQPEHADESRWIPRTIAGVAGFCSRHPGPVVVFTLLTCALALYGSFFHLQYQSQRTDMLSPHKDCYQRWQKYVAEFGDDEDMVVVVRGKDRGQMRSALEALADAVRQDSDHFDRLFYKVDLRPLANRALLFLPVEQIREKIQDNIKKMGLLLDPPLVGKVLPLIGWRQLSLQQLLEQADSRLAALRRGEPARPGDEQFFQQLSAICQSAATSLAPGGQYANPWLSLLPASLHPLGRNSVPAGQANMLAEPQFFFSDDGTLAFLLVRPVKEADGGFTAAKKSVDALRGVIARTASAFPSLRFGLTGLPVLETDEMVASQNDTTLASWLALAGVALLYLVVYRGFRYPLMTVATLLVGTCWALGWTTLTVGHLNILSSAFAVMLIGMGDYGVLWVTRFRQERQAGAALPGAMRTTALCVGPGIVTASLTTALAFYATMLADFKAMAELGWIAGSGVLFCALACFSVMPALLTLFDFRFEKKTAAPILPLQPAGEDKALWLPWVARRPALVIGVSLAVTCLFALVASRVKYDHNLLNLQAQSLESVKWEHLLIEHTAGASWHALSITNTPEEALALKARYEQLPGVSRVIEVASLVPADQDRKLALVRDIHHRLRKLPQRGKTIPHAKPDIGPLRATVDRLSEPWPKDKSPTKPVRSLLAKLGQLQTVLWKVDPPPAADRLQEFDQHLARDLADDLHRLRDVATPAPITLADLPECLRERFIGKSGKWLLRVFGKECLWEYVPLRRFVQQIQTVDAEAAGNPFTTLEGLRLMKEGFLWAGLYALIAMVLVLFLDFRNWKHTLAALAPLAMGLVVALGIMTLCGWPLNPANMIAFPLILGVGADNGVHVLHDYRSRGAGRRYLLGQAIGRGIMVAALTTILGFGTLLFATHRGLASLGLILTLGVTCCMLTALVFLPALLHVQSIRRQKQLAAGPVQEVRRAAA